MESDQHVALAVIVDFVRRSAPTVPFLDFIIFFWLPAGRPAPFCNHGGRIHIVWGFCWTILNMSYYTQKKKKKRKRLLVMLVALALTTLDAAPEVN